MNDAPYLVFSVRGKRRIVGVRDVREIAPLMSLELVDGGRGSFRGIMNLRGEIVPVFDLDSVDAVLHPSRLVLVAIRGDSIVGLLVDEVHEVIHIDARSVVTRSIGDGTTMSAVRLNGELLTVLDPGRADLGGAADVA